MPELPEVETIVRDLRPHLVGKRISALTVGDRALRRPWSKEWESGIDGKRIESVSRRGKWIVLNLGGPFLLIHLGMTGQLQIFRSDEPIANHTHAIFDFPGKKQLRFRDIRRFGSLTFFLHESTLRVFFKEVGLGPEPFDVDSSYWRNRLETTNRCLKAVLLDQRVVAGVGNIYADEALFEARLHPARQGKDLNPRESGRLRKAVVTVLNRAISRRGSTIRNYVGGSGLSGNYQREFRVYGRTGESCGRCGASIQRARLAGRSTHFCPNCQREVES